MRRPLLPKRWGPVVVSVLCGYELVALYGPLPPITHICRRWRIAGVLLVFVLAHHLLVEESS